MSFKKELFFLIFLIFISFLAQFLTIPSAIKDGDSYISMLHSQGTMKKFISYQQNDNWFPISKAKKIFYPNPRTTYTDVALSISEHDCHPPFYFILLRAWNNLIRGNPFLIARYFSLFLSLVLIITSYFFLRFIFNWKTAFWGAWIISFSPIITKFAIKVRQYILFYLLVVGSSYLLLKFIQSPKIVYLFFFALFSLAGLFTHYLYALFLLTQSLFFVYQNQNKKREILAYIFLLALASLPFLYWLYYFYPLQYHPRHLFTENYLLPKKFPFIFIKDLLSFFISFSAPKEIKLIYAFIIIFIFSITLIQRKKISQSPSFNYSLTLIFLYPLLILLTDFIMKGKILTINKIKFPQQLGFLIFILFVFNNFKKEKTKYLLYALVITMQLSGYLLNFNIMPSQKEWEKKFNQLDQSASRGFIFIDKGNYRGNLLNFIHVLDENVFMANIRALPEEDYPLNRIQTLLEKKINTRPHHFDFIFVVGNKLNNLKWDFPNYELIAKDKYFFTLRKKD